MSVGHIARGFEEAGIATVIIAVKSFRRRMEMMALPRVLLTNNLVGRVLGTPNAPEEHKSVLLKAFELLEQTEENGIIEEMV